MAKRLMSTDPLTGINTYHDYDETTDITHIQTVQDVEPIIERNKALHNTDVQSQGIKRNWMLVGSIPNVIIQKWITEDGINLFNRDHWPAVKRKLKDPDYRYLTAGTKKI